MNNPKDKLNIYFFKNIFNSFFLGVWEGCLGVFLEDVWGVFGGMFVAFCKDLGGKNRGQPKGENEFIIIFLNI